MTSERVATLIAFESQRRVVEIDLNDDLKTIENRIKKLFQIENSREFDENYQIQFYSQSYETFIDLYSGTWTLFKTFRDDLITKNSEIDRKVTSWNLQIVRRVISISHREENSSQVNISSANQCNEQMSPQSSRDVRTSVSHPYHIRFLINIADRQRRQYESDMKRKRDSTTSTNVGGVFLRGDIQENRPSSIYPTIQFDIPSDKVNQSWSLYVYVLTEPDQNGIQYLHASKGILDSFTSPQDRFGPIDNSNLVNPQKIELKKSDIEQGQYELRLRVCNIRNLPVLRHENLRMFPEIGRFILYQDKGLISNVTTASLNLNSDRFHLGCILASQYIVQDRCISNLAIESDKKRKNSAEHAESKKQKLS